VSEKNVFFYEIFVFRGNVKNLEAILSRVAVLFVNKTVLRIRDVYSGYELFHPGSRAKQSASKNLSIFNPKNCSGSSGKWYDLHFDLDFFTHSRSRGQNGTGSWIPDPGSATLQ
jgi:hypothetical protein